MKIGVIAIFLSALLTLSCGTGNFFERGKESAEGAEEEVDICAGITPSDPEAEAAFSSDVLPLLTASCSGCHANKAPSYAAALSYVTAGSPASSALYTKAIGQGGHSVLWASTSSQATALSNWICSL